MVKTATVTIMFVVFFVSIIGIIGTTLLINYLNQQHHRRPLISFEYVIKNAKAGDLVFFRHKEAVPLPRIMFGDEFSHVGIITEKNNNKYICEAVGEGDMYLLNDYTAGVKCKLLSERLRTYEGYICIKFLNKPLNPDKIRQINDYFESVKNRPFCDIEDSRKILKLMQKCDNLSHHHDDDFKDCVFCSSFIMDIVKLIGRIGLDPTTDSKCYRPQNLEVISSQINTVGEYPYSITYELGEPRFPHAPLLHRGTP